MECVGRSVGDADEADGRLGIGVYVDHQTKDIRAGGNEVPRVVATIPGTGMRWIVLAAEVTPSSQHPLWQAAYEATRQIVDLNMYGYLRDTTEDKTDSGPFVGTIIVGRYHRWIRSDLRQNREG